VTVSIWTTQLGQAATSHSWQRAVRPGCSSVTPHSHVVDIVLSSPRSKPRGVYLWFLECGRATNKATLLFLYPG